MLVNKIYDDVKSVLAKANKDIYYVTLRENKTDYTINFFNTAAVKIKFGKNNYFYIKAESESFPKEYEPQML